MAPDYRDIVKVRNSDAYLVKAFFLCVCRPHSPYGNLINEGKNKNVLLFLRVILILKEPECIFRLFVPLYGTECA